MKYDDASWHYGGNFPADLEPGAAATHIGLFIAWALLSGLGGELHISEAQEGVALLKARAITPGQFVLEHCDEKFTDDDLNALGNRFAASYYAAETGGYLADYDSIFMRPRLFRRAPASLYHVPDTWASFEKIAPVIDKRFARWQLAEG